MNKLKTTLLALVAVFAFTACGNQEATDKKEEAPAQTETSEENNTKEDEKKAEEGKEEGAEENSDKKYAGKH